MDYEIVIGLEVHVELMTKSKIFCSCSTDFGCDVNENTCPVCTGMPGTLPVLNKKAVEYTIRAGLTANCSIAGFSKQDRKNYFYPDLPKAYQISQYDLPFCNNGFIEIDSDNGRKKIRILRIHLEEDAGKLIHDDLKIDSYVDYNRCGVPLIEIVSEPDIRSAKEARVYVEKLRNMMIYAGVSDCKMQEGSLRVDVNLSVREKGRNELGIRTEMKNLNSFKSIERAIESEAKRQIQVIEEGGKIIQETRRWDDEKGISYSMRNKEDAHDYRYFPDPDLVPVILNKEEIEKIRADLPEMPDKRKSRYVNEYNIPEYDADIITSSRHLADFFEEAVNAGADAKTSSNWIMGDTMRILNDKNLTPEDIPFKGKELAELINLDKSNRISSSIAKKVYHKMFETGKPPSVIVKEEGLEAVNDEKELLEIINKIITQNEKSVNDYKSGNKKAIGFLIGQVMKQTKGKANPQMVNKILSKKLN